MQIGDVAAAIGKGLLAGAAGTLAMTAAQMVEMRLQDRESSSTPAAAAEKVLKVRFVDESARERATQIVHFGYGTGLGALRGALGAAGLSGAAAAATYFATVWGLEMVMLPALGLSPPITRWSKEQVASDAGMHAVYAGATSAIYDWLDAHSASGRHDGLHQAEA